MSTKRSGCSSLGVLLALVLTMTWASDASAYATYTATPNSGNCFTCHGDFDSGTYQDWGTNLMSGHGPAIGACDGCHTAFGAWYPTSTFISGNATFNISCLGCHGRDEGAAGIQSAGLRQRHWTAGIEVCGSCHPADSDPGVFVPVGEDVLPPYYGLGGAVSLTDPCNPGGSGEHVAGAGTAGLDNDGDGFYDEADPDCALPTPTPTPGPSEVPIETASLVMKDDTTEPIRTSRRRLRFVSNTRRASPGNQIVPPARDSGDDPTIAGGTVMVLNTDGSGEMESVFLPPSGWSAVGSDQHPRGFLYRAVDSGASITSVRIRENRIVIRGGGGEWAYSLNEDVQGSVAVVLSLGSKTWCGDTAGGQPRDDRRDRFVARHLPAPASCPAPIDS